MMLKIAEKAKQRKFFLSSTFSIFQSAHGINDEELSQILGCSIDDLNRLALCRKPNSEILSFKEEVEQISNSFSVDKVRLAQIIKEVDSIILFREIDHSNLDNKGFLIAARENEGREEG